MSGSDVMGWLAFALNVWGNLELTDKSVRGWVVRLACNACWIPYSVSTGAWALLVNHLTFAAINVYGWWKWRLACPRDGDCPAGECPACNRRRRPQ